MLDHYKETYDVRIAAIKRRIKAGKQSKDYTLGELAGVYSMMLDCIIQCDDEIKIVDHQVEVFGEKYDIGIDDPGQCYYIEVGSKQYGLGTYNLYPESDILYCVFTYIHEQNKEEILKLFEEVKQ